MIDTYITVQQEEGSAVVVQGTTETLGDLIYDQVSVSDIIEEVKSAVVKHVLETPELLALWKSPNNPFSEAPPKKEDVHLVDVQETGISCLLVFSH